MWQSSIDVTDLNRHLQDYTRLTFSGLLYNPEPKNILIIGLGGGIIPRQMHNLFPDSKISVVEIDPEVVMTAKKYFHFKPGKNLRVHVADGRVFVKRQARTAAQYDFILLDAFNNEYIPFHLTTLEFLQEVKNILTPQGIVVANIFYNNKLFDAEVKTFIEAFGKSFLYFGKQSSNAMVISPGSRDFSAINTQEAVRRAKNLARNHQFYFDLVSVAKLLDPVFKYDPTAQVLTDDRAPVNVLRRRPR